jgi:hypothetical protein
MTDPAQRQPADSSRRSRFTTLLDRAEPVRVLRFLLRPTTRWAISWFIALAMLGFAVEYAHIAFDDRERADGNWGHASIDFGGQWVMGRTIVEGDGRQLYNRNYIRRAVESGYPPGGEGSKAKNTDAANLLSWLAGGDDAEAPRVVASFLAPLAATNPCEEVVLLARGEEVWTPPEIEHVTAPHLGGALYPPIHALLYAPLSLLPPRVAYRVVQAVLLVLVFFDGWVIQRMTAGRVWWPVGSAFLMIFPGFNGCISLGQNGILSMTVVLVGWWQLMRGRDGWAGVVWGLLAFKPVWAAAFFLVPLLTRRWRMAAGMAVSGLVQIALTLPVVGWQSWLDWLQIGRMAAIDYLRQENWIFLSRDLLGIPRRWLLDFDGGIAVDVEKHPLPTVLGWSLWTVVLVLTLFVAWRGRRRMQAVSGSAPSFVALGAIFACYHFMYYDVMIAVLPVVLLFTEPRRYLRPLFWRWPPPAYPVEKVVALQRYYQPTLNDLTLPPLPLLPEGRRPRWVRAPIPPLLVFLLLIVPPVSIALDPSYHFPPSETFILLLLWAWCGYRVLIDRAEKDESVGSDAVGLHAAHTAKFAELGADVGGAHERLADEYGADAGRL